MRTIEARPLHTTPDILGESPCWHQGAFWWVDIEAKLFQRLDSDGTYQRWNLPERVGCAVPAEDGTWILGLESGLGRLHLHDGRVEFLVRLQFPPGQYRFNDGKADPRGRLVIGTMSLAAPVPTAVLYRFENGKLIQLLDQVGTSNGLAWSEDGRILYYIDSKTGRIDYFDYCLETGELNNRRVLVQGAPRGRPDGMCMDAEGNLWAGHWGGWAVRCYCGRTGRCLAEIPVPCANVTSCCFGGVGMDELFITTASKNLQGEDFKEQPGAGKVFVAHPGVKGGPVYSTRL